MTYHCGIGHGIPGIAPREPHLTCDGCGDRYDIKPTGAARIAPAWLLDNKTPRGWKARPIDEFKSKHFCPKCKSKEG